LTRMTARSSSSRRFLLSSDFFSRPPYSGRLSCSPFPPPPRDFGFVSGPAMNLFFFFFSFLSDHGERGSVPFNTGIFLAPSFHPTAIGFLFSCCEPWLLRNADGEFSPFPPLWICRRTPFTVFREDDFSQMHSSLCFLLLLKGGRGAFLQHSMTRSSR